MELTAEAEGKHVVDQDGTTIGTVSSVEGSRAHVHPDPGVSETIKSKLGWGNADDETYPIDEADIESVGDDEVMLKR